MSPSPKNSPCPRARRLGPGVALAACVVATACAAGTPAAHWRVLAPLPDPVGYGGMFAGVLNGRLVAGGGSQWDRPIWRGGERRVSDRIFTLDALDGAWNLSPSRLPAPVGHCASAATSDAILLAGGLGAAGAVRTVLEVRADGRTLATRSRPDLPHPLVYATGAILGGRFWVVGGLEEPNARQASCEVWSLSLGEPTGGSWRREPDLPGSGVFVAATAADDRALYVFGGMGFAANGGLAPSARAYRLIPGEKTWQRLPDLPEPRVGAASPCPLAPGGRIFLIGGYAEVAAAAPREHPGFPAETLWFDTGMEVWGRGPALPVSPVPDRDAAGDPGPSPMMGAPVVAWQDHAVVVSGEVRASTRSPAVVAWPLASPLDQR